MAPLEGVHRVRAKLASGFAEYWYAWRGGPKILSESATTKVLLQLKVDAAAHAAGEKYYALQRARTNPTPSAATIATLIVSYQASPDFKFYRRGKTRKPRSQRTLKDMRDRLSIVSETLGAMPVRALEAKGARQALIQWRDRFQATPRKADSLASALSDLLSWARDQGLTAADPMREWPWIYSVDRSEILWTAEEVEVLCKIAGKEEDLEFQLAFLFSAYSGLRKTDALRLPKTAIGKETLIRRTSKRGKVVHVPITAPLRQVLAICDLAADATTLLTKNGKPWKSSTLDKAFAAYRVEAIKIMPSIEGKRWHDLRGTYATSLHREGYEDDDVDRIMGWAKGSSEITRASYVSGDVIAHAAIARARRNRHAMAQAQLAASA
jgi:integrase